jgi:hypothetical protein
MPRWVADVQGYREILDADGEPVRRRKTFQVIGATVTDDGEVTVIEVPPGAGGATGATGATGPSGDTTATQFQLADDFMCTSPGLTATGVIQGDRAPWSFVVLGGTAEASQRTVLESNHPGQLIVATGPTTGEWTLTLGDASRVTNFTTFLSATFVWRVSAAFALSIASLGISDVNAPEAAANAAYFQIENGVSTHIRAKTRDGSADTSNVDTGVTIAGSTWYVLKIDKDPATQDLRFYINGSLVATTTAATHGIDAGDAFKLTVYYKNGNAGVSNPILDLVQYASISTLDRTV